MAGANGDEHASRRTLSSALVLGSIVLMSSLLAAVPANAADQQPLAWQGTAWSWGSPRPQGEDLAWVDFAGARGLAGSGSTLLSEDAGETWKQAPASTPRAELEFVDEGKTLVGNGGCRAAYRSEDGGATYRKLPLGIPGRTGCIDVDFPSVRVGYALVGASILRSEDGGRSFSPRTPVMEAIGLRFVSSEVGFAYTTFGVVYRTDDGAGSWTPVASVASGVTDLWFVDDSVGYMIGRNSTVLRTTDGGRSWSRAPMAGAPRLNLQRIRCGSRERCLITTAPVDRPPDRRTALLLTTDGGASARSVPSTEGTAAVDFISPTRVVGVGMRGLTLVSDDAGRSFTTIGGGADQEYRQLRRVDASLLYAFGSRAIGRSVDGGRSWITSPMPQPLPRRVYLKDASFAGRGEGLALQAHEDLRLESETRLFRTDDGGRTWRLLRRGRLGNLSAVLALRGSRVVTLGRRGVRVSRNGGRRLRPVHSPRVRRARLFAFDRVGAGVVAYGPRALALSSDLRRWHFRRLPRGVQAQEVDFVSAQVGYMIDADYQLRRTRNGGRTWSVLPATGPYLGFSDRLQHIAFSNARTGFVAATIDSVNPETGRGTDYYDRAVMLRTDDGGRSFRPQFQRGGSFFGDVSAPARGSSVMAIFPGLMWSPTGGDAPTRTRLTARSSTRRLRRGQRVGVGGRLRPTRPGDAVVISRRSGFRLWVRRVNVRADGTFASRWRLTRSSIFVVQWRGRGDRRGAGTRAIRVKVRR